MEKNNQLIERISKIEARLDNLEKMRLRECKNIPAEMIQSEKSVNSKTSNINVGMLSYCGKYESPDGEIAANFGGDVYIPNILKTNSRDLAQVIDAFSSEDRINIVKLLLKKSLSAKEIMEILDFPTTGKVYHHLSFLEKLGIIRKNNEKFSISGRYISCVVFIILGVSKIVEEGR